MFEEYIEFDVLPSYGNGICGLHYTYKNKLPMADYEIEYKESKVRILNVTTDFYPNYRERGFDHLGTKLFIDMLIDLQYRLKKPVKQITGRLSCADNIRGTWIRSIPVYIDLPVWVEQELPCNLNFSLFVDRKRSIPVTEEMEYIKTHIKDFCAKFGEMDDLFFQYDLQWNDSVSYHPVELPLASRMPELR